MWIEAYDTRTIYLGRLRLPAGRPEATVVTVTPPAVTGGPSNRELLRLVTRSDSATVTVTHVT